jgi:hypothetical protein
MASARKKSSVSATSTSRSTRPTESKFVVGVANRAYPASLELHKIYRVLPDKEAQRDGDLRVIDESGEDYLESGEDYLYPAEWFVAVNVPQAVKTSLLRAS